MLQTPMIEGLLESAAPFPRSRTASARSRTPRSSIASTAVLIEPNRSSGSRPTSDGEPWRFSGHPARRFRPSLGRSGPHRTAPCGVARWRRCRSPLHLPRDPFLAAPSRSRTAGSRDRRACPRLSLRRRRKPVRLPSARRQFFRITDLCSDAWLMAWVRMGAMGEVDRVSGFPWRLGQRLRICRCPTISG